MNAQSKIEAEPPLAKLREPFAPRHISKLPKETRAQIDERKADRNSAINCGICGGWHHKRAIHLDYVGHAALTDRLLDTDIEWSWEPVAFTPDGLPAFDKIGGLWIKLTVCGVSRYGYGTADGKVGGDAVKEIIGDALRNAAMRFGAALDLWHKGDLHGEEEPQEPQEPQAEAKRARRDDPFPQGPAKNKTELKDMGRAFWRDVEAAGDPDQLDILLGDKGNVALVRQIEAALPSWWKGGTRDGEEFEGLGEVIARRKSELALAAVNAG